ncbi:MAG: phage tail assembly protein [Burkholderiales bacterium]|nr:phage tail assembly protein [Burkholderiales bacterium]
MIHQLNKVYKFQGEEHTEINAPFEELTGLDYEIACNQFKTLNPNFAGAIELEPAFLTQILVNACKKPIEFFTGLPMNEYAKLKLAVQGFLLG